MTKLHITQRDAKASNTIVLAVPYGDLQHTLMFESPIAYNGNNAEGWNFNLYQLNGCHSIVTGYRKHGKACTHRLNDYPELKTALAKLEKESRADNAIDSNKRAKAKLIELLDYHLVM